MDEISVTVHGHPPAKSEAKSLLAAGHPRAHEVKTLLLAVQNALPPVSRRSLFGPDPVVLTVRVTSAARPRSDATNILGGVADVLEVKARRGALPDLGDLAEVALYDDDRQIEEVHYFWTPLDAGSDRYEVVVRRR